MHVHVTFNKGNFLEMNYLRKVHVALTSAPFCMLRLVVGDVLSVLVLMEPSSGYASFKVFQSIKLTFVIESN